MELLWNTAGDRRQDKRETPEGGFKELNSPALQLQVLRPKWSPKNEWFHSTRCLSAFNLNTWRLLCSRLDVNEASDVSFI